MLSNPPTTFGLSVRKSWMSRLLRGRSRSCCSSRPRVIAWLSIVMLVPPAVTVTTSSRLPIARLRSISATAAARSTTPVRCAFLKPVNVAVTVYVPERRFGSSNRPCASVCASRATPVDSSVTTTVAPGTTCCCGSKTVPRMVPSVVCAAAGSARAKRTNGQTAYRRALGMLKIFLPRMTDRRPFVVTFARECQSRFKAEVQYSRYLATSIQRPATITRSTVRMPDTSRSG